MRDLEGGVSPLAARTTARPRAGTTALPRPSASAGPELLRQGFAANLAGGVGRGARPECDAIRHLIVDEDAGDGLAERTLGGRLVQNDEGDENVIGRRVGDGDRDAIAHAGALLDVGVDVEQVDAVAAPLDRVVLAA